MDFSQEDNGYCKIFIIFEIQLKHPLFDIGK